MPREQKRPAEIADLIRAELHAPKLALEVRDHPAFGWEVYTLNGGTQVDILSVMRVADKLRRRYDLQR